MSRRLRLPCGEERWTSAPIFGSPVVRRGGNLHKHCSLTSRGEGKCHRLLPPPLASGRHVILQLSPRSGSGALGSFPWLIECGAVAVVLTTG